MLSVDPIYNPSLAFKVLSAKQGHQFQSIGLISILVIRRRSTEVVPKSITGLAGLC